MDGNRFGILFLVGLALVITTTPAWAAFSDNFNYPVGPLAGNGSWLPTGVTTSRIMVNNGSAGISVHADTQHSMNNDIAYVTNLSESGQVHFTVDIKGVQQTTALYDWWSLTLKSDTGWALGSWTGKSDCFTAWGNGSATQQLVLDGNQHPLEATIDFTNGTVNYSYFNSPVYNYTFSGAGSSIAYIEFCSVGFGPMENLPPEHVYFNNLAITPEPVSLSLLGIGCFLAFRRRR